MPDSADTTTRTGRAQRVLSPLNIGLLLAAAGLGLANLAGAQQQPARSPGNYLLVGGQINRGDSNGIWVVDTNNRDMVLLRWQQGNTGFEGLGYRSLANDLTAPTGR
ncbi:MAG: hypothetical protein AAGI17_00075 [Planctomycetota bacterium]